MVIEIADSQVALPVKQSVRALSRAPVVSQKAQEAPSPLSVPDKAAFVADGRQQASATPADITKLVDTINARPQVQKRALQFSVHESTGKTQVRVYDSETNQLIRQFPSDELLRIAEQIDEVLADNASGIILQDQA